MTDKQKNLLIRVIVAGILMVILTLLPLDDYPILRFLLFLIPYLTVGYDILRKAFKGIKNKQVFDEHFLMAVATIGAMALGEYTEGVAVMWFYQIGELFQSYAVGKSRRNIAELMDIRPDYANIENEDGSIEKVDPDDIEIGTIIVVQPGEKIPIDGVIREGNTTLNTAASRWRQQKSLMSQQLLRSLIWLKMQAPESPNPSSSSQSSRESILRQFATVRSRLQSSRQSFDSSWVLIRSGLSGSTARSHSLSSAAHVLSLSAFR